jgi:VWFA-related protein
MKRLAAVLLLTLTVPAAAQVIESIEVHLLEVEASVLGRDGKPVDGLTEKDFVVEIDGKPAEVTNFFAVRRGRVEDGDPATPERVIPTRMTIFIDDVHLHPMAKAHAIQSLRKFVEKGLDPAATTSIVSWNGSLRVIVPPTKDKAKLLKGVELVAREPGRLPPPQASDEEFLAVVAEVTDVPEHFQDLARMRSLQSKQTMKGLAEVVESMAGLTGRRVVLVVGQGLPMARTEDVKTMVETAQQNAVTVSALDPSFSEDQGELSTTALRTAAAATGGQMIENQNDLGRALASVTEQATTYYSLAVPAPSGGTAYDVQVRLRNHPGMKVVTAGRRGVPTAEERIVSTLRARLYSREQENPLNVRVALVPPHKTGDRCAAAFQVGVPASQLTLLPVGDAVKGEMAVRFAVLDDRDSESEVQTTAKEVWPAKGEIVRETVTMGLKAGHKYVLSVAVTDGLSQETSYLQTEVDAGVCR